MKARVRQAVAELTAMYEVRDMLFGLHHPLNVLQENRAVFAGVPLSRDVFLLLVAAVVNTTDDIAWGHPVSSDVKPAPPSSAQGSWLMAGAGVITASLIFLWWL
jgi:hypothetical protein